MKGSRLRLMPYPKTRVLEDVAFTQRLIPTRIYSVLMPVWQVEIQAEVTEGEPFDLIDRYLELGMWRAGLNSVEKLARFFALDCALVDQALGFLAAIGHVRRTEDTCALTPLGEKSVQDGKRYTVTLEDRRKLYFDGFTSVPLHRDFYDPKTVEFLITVDKRQKFYPLSPNGAFRNDVVTELVSHPERDRFNLPDHIDNPTVLNVRTVYLPTYVVRAEQAGIPQFQVYSPINDRLNLELSTALRSEPDNIAVLENEYRETQETIPVRTRIVEWMNNKGIRRCHPTERDGIWRVTVPASCVTEGTIAPHEVGSFQMLGRDDAFFQLWCDDEETRRTALLARMKNYVGARICPDHAEVMASLNKMHTQLRLPPMDIAQLTEFASCKKEYSGLAARLEQFT